MTDNKKTEMERKEQLERTRKVARETLDDGLVQRLIGGANVKSNPFLYGQLGLKGGEQSYIDAKSSEDFGKKRGEIYQQILQNKDSRNPEEPQISDYDVVQSYFRQIDQGAQILTLGQLEEVVGGLIKKTGSSLDYSLPDKFRDKSYIEILENVANEKGEVNEENLSEEDKVALTAHKSLTDAYQRACGLKAASVNYFSDLNNLFKNISDKYNSEENANSE